MRPRSDDEGDDDDTDARERARRPPTKRPWSEPTLRAHGNFAGLVQAHRKSIGRSDGHGFKPGVG